MPPKELLRLRLEVGTQSPARTLLLLLCVAVFGAILSQKASLPVPVLRHSRQHPPRAGLPGPP